MPMVTFGSTQKENCVQQEEDNVQQTNQAVKNNSVAEDQSHVHEFLGSTLLPLQQVLPHNHRFAGVTGEIILVPGGHIHAFFTSADFFGHLHDVAGITDLQIPVDGGKHVHYALATTSFNAGHDHDFQFATLIDEPLIIEGNAC